jgi:PAS domain S-box-containing protein
MSVRFGWFPGAVRPLRRALARALRGLASRVGGGEGAPPAPEDDAQRRERASQVSLEGHWELDLIKHTRWHSASFQALLGHPAQPLHDSLDEAAAGTHPDDVLSTDDIFEARRGSDAPIDVHVRLRMAQGSYRWFRMRGGVQRNVFGRPWRISGSVHDVHEQKCSEDALRAAQARLERAVQGTQDGLWEIDLGGERPRFWLSARLHELLGFAEGELGDHSDVLRERVHPEDLPISDAAIFAKLPTGVPLDIEVRMRTKQGEYRWYRMRGRPLFDSSARILRTSGSIQDVTEARAAREELVRASVAAEAASRAKSAFLATVSHEIRTPMNGIIGMTTLLLDTVLGRVQREYAEAVRTSATSLLAIINDILDFSKIEAGKLEIDSVPMDLRVTAEDVGALLALPAATKGVELLVEVDPEVPQAMLGDPQRIRQCLVNLVGNAVKFTDAGEVAISVAMAGYSAQGPLVRFAVRDTGRGIAPESYSELFRPFTQLDSSTTRMFGGTGLGLSIVKRLCELMGGEVGLESELGRGSTFWFTLPLRIADASARAAVPRVHGGGRRILLIDDNATVRRVLGAQLEAWDFAVTRVSSAEAALAELSRALARQRLHDLVLIDERMPDVDGAALGEQIAGRTELAHPRLVLLSSLDRRPDPTRLAGLGFLGCLSKPVRARELARCLDRVLASEGQDWSVGTYPGVTGGPLASASEQRRYVGRVLVVEDNPVNQKVAQKFLERLGASVQLESDGAAAVSACRQGRFDLILMDMQMPVMDGIAATRAIRAEEGTARRTPIVALTANVLAGQSQSCFDAGMDDVLAKPLEVRRLQEVLDRFILQRPPPGLESPRTGPDLAPAPIDLARLASLAGGDAAFMREILTTFKLSSSTLLEELRAALQARSPERLRRAAHKLKGASDNIGAPRLGELAARLEAAQANLDWSPLGGWVAALAGELQALDEFVAPGEVSADPARRAS